MKTKITLASLLLLNVLTPAAYADAPVSGGPKSSESYYERMKREAGVAVLKSKAISIPNVLLLDSMENKQAPQDTDYISYLTRLKQRISRTWNQMEGNKSKPVIVLFKLRKDGTIISNEIKNSSKDEAVDQAALKTIEDTAPFHQLPWGSEGITVQFTFNKKLIAK